MGYCLIERLFLLIDLKSLTFISAKEIKPTPCFLFNTEIKNMIGIPQLTWTFRLVSLIRVWLDEKSWSFVRCILNFFCDTFKTKSFFSFDFCFWTFTNCFFHSEHFFVLGFSFWNWLFFTFFVHKTCSFVFKIEKNVYSPVSSFVFTFFFFNWWRIQESRNFVTNPKKTKNIFTPINKNFVKKNQYFPLNNFEKNFTNLLWAENVLKFWKKQFSQTNFQKKGKYIFFNVLNFDEKNRDLKIPGGGNACFPPPPLLEKISLQVLFLVKNKFFFFQRL